MARTAVHNEALEGGDQPRVLFVSRRNSLRSVLAEACLVHVSRGRCRAHSCGVPGQLAHEVHLAATAALRQAGMASPAHAPLAWSAPRARALRPDVVILLDPLQDVDLPSWPGQPGTALWTYPDLAAAGGGVSPADTTNLLHSLRRRLELLVTLLTRCTEGTALRNDIRDIAYL